MELGEPATMLLRSGYIFVRIPRWLAFGGVAGML